KSGGPKLIPFSQHARPLSKRRPHLVDAAFDGKVSAKTAVKTADVELLCCPKRERSYQPAPIAEPHMLRNAKSQSRQLEHALQQRHVAVPNRAIRARRCHRIERPARRDTIRGALPAARSNNRRELSRYHD